MRSYAPDTPLYRQMIGNAVASLRETNDWTQEQLATRAGLRIDNISRIEAGAMSVKFYMIDRIAEAFGVDINLFVPRLQEGVK